jgi:hypothetical protein
VAAISVIARSFNASLLSSLVVREYAGRGKGRGFGFGAWVREEKGSKEGSDGSEDASERSCTDKLIGEKGESTTLVGEKGGPSDGSEISSERPKPDKAFRW